MKKWQKVLLGTAGVLGACAWLWWQDEPLAPQAQAWLEPPAESADSAAYFQLLGLDAPEYDAILQEIPQVAVATLKGVAHRLTQSQHAIHMLAGAPLEQRLAALLLVLADKVGKPWNEAMLLDVPLAREDLAAMAGAATESVSRLFSQWQREGWIDAGRRWVAIVDAARLEQVRDGMV